MLNSSNLTTDYSRGEQPESRPKKKRVTLSKASSSKRAHSQSSHSKRKFLPPIDPKLYRINITSETLGHSKKKKTTKVNSNKNLIPVKTETKRKPPSEIKETKTFAPSRRRKVKYVSLRSFNIARMSWTGNKPNVEKIIKKKRLAPIQEKKKPQVYQHFSNDKSIRKKKKFKTLARPKNLSSSYTKTNKRELSAAAVKNKVSRSTSNKGPKGLISSSPSPVTTRNDQGSESGEGDNLSFRKQDLITPTKKNWNTQSSINIQKRPTTAQVNSGKRTEISLEDPPSTFSSNKNVIPLKLKNQSLTGKNSPTNANVPMNGTKGKIIKGNVPGVKINSTFTFGNNEMKKTGIIKSQDKELLNNELKKVSITNLSFQSVTSKNIELNSEIQNTLEKLIDRSVCVYCLKRVNHPITLSCGHELCLECAKEVYSIHSFMHISLPEMKIKCPKCAEKTIFQSELETLLRQNWRPQTITEQNQKVQLCEICPSSKYIRDVAEFECLNCDIIMCYECRIRHLSNIRHQDHKIIQYHKIIQEKVELTLCEVQNHREPLKLYCNTCKKPICLICANYENEHKGHDIKTVRNIIDEQAILLTTAMREKENQIRIMKEIVEDMKYSKEKIEKERTEFLEKADKIFAELYELIKKKEAALKNEITTIFASKLDVISLKLKNLSLVERRYEYYRNLICDRDIDIIDRVIQIQKLNKKITKIEGKGLLVRENVNRSLGNSLLIDEPIKVIKTSIEKLQFIPITEVNISILTKIFAKSQIISPDMLIQNFVKILPKIKSGVLLYQTSTDGVSPVTFHEKCDNKGPTITIVKTDTGHIFGGFNPISWISEAMYNECEDSFIFSLSNGEVINPVRCNVKRYMKYHAIKQNEKMYSPGFGEIDSADLFISYKNLANSYSNLGKVYKAPKDVDPNKFLAGKPNKWKIVEVEVYAVEIIPDNEYIKLVLN